MRIAVFAPDPAAKDGIAAHTQSLVDAWVQAGHVVQWFYPSAGTHVAAAADLSPDADPTPARRARQIGALKRSLTSFKPDVVLVLFAIPAVRTSLGSLILTARAMKQAGVPVLICCHEASRELALLGPVCRVIYRMLRWCSTGFVAFSAIESQTMLDAGLAPSVTTVPLGVEEPDAGPDAIERVKQSYDVRSPLVLAIGWITHSKGTDLLVRAMPEVARGGADVQCVVAGEVRPRTGIFRPFGWADQRYGASLEREASASSGLARISMAGYVPNQDLGALMQAATIVVLPYRSVTQSAIAARAVTAGTPIVASDLPGMIAQLGESARYFRAGDHHDLARVLTEVLGDSRSRESMAQASRDRKESESYEHVAQTILDAADAPGSGL